MTEGVLHVYHSARNLNLLEHTPFNSSLTSRPHPLPPPKNVLLFVGGMFDTLNQPQYVADIARLFPISTSQQWRVMHVQLSSAGRAWGILDLDRDIEEIAQAINYLRTTLYSNPELSIVLMGHSTGCQDIMRYLTAPNPLAPNKPTRPKIQGAILQAAVSDRDTVTHSISDSPTAAEAYKSATALIAETPTTQHRETILPMNLTKPLFGPAPVSIARFLSLTSPTSPTAPSTEDFFSSDLSPTHLATTFGRIGTSRLLSRANHPSITDSILILLADSDEYAHPHISQRELLAKWRAAMGEGTGAEVHGDSAVILNALHDVGGDDWPSMEARLVVLRKKVMAYLKDVAGGIDGVADEVWHREGDAVLKVKRDDGRDEAAASGVLKL